MEVKIKKLHKDAVIPKYAKNGDAGLDLTAVSYEFDEYGNIVYHTGLAFEIPEGYVGLLFPRSSICKKDISLANSVGVIDSSFRGEVIAKFKPTITYKAETYDTLERIAQIIIIPYPQIELIEVEELSKTDRGDGGFGSTNK